MKKKINIDKEINFPTMIGEVCAISLEHDLKFIDESNIEGNLLLSGKYKFSEASRLEEDFNYDIPTEIILSEKLDLNTTNIEISDFYYEIENDYDMICHVEILVEGVELLDEDVQEEKTQEVRECDGDKVEIQEIEIPTIKEAEEEEKEEQVDEVSNDVKSLFSNLDDDKDNYGTFIVYIVRKNETINSIIEKYKTTLEDIEQYNDIKDINIGTKLIIPLKNE